MSFFSNFFNKKTDNLLIGEWFSDLENKKTKDEIGDVKMVFNRDGKLIYETREGTKRQIINMIFSIEGNSLITDQPSNPKKERTDYYFIDDDTLVLKFNGEETHFVKNRSI